MTEPAADGGVPASLAAIMAAIRAEMAAPAAAAPPVTAPAPLVAPSLTAPASRDAPPLTAAASSAPPPGIDAETRALLAPLLREWLDAHLPEIVEAAVHAEIRRLTGHS